MKRLLLLAMTCLCPITFGANAIINCASGTLGTSYSTSSPSLQTTLTNLYTRVQPTLVIVNPTSVRVCANTVTSSSTVAPTAGNGNEHCIAAGAIGFFDQIDIPRGPVNVYLRADQASCTTGIIDVDIY